jgi:hypothetical protein
VVVVVDLGACQITRVARGGGSMSDSIRDVSQPVGWLIDLFVVGAEMVGYSN